MSSAKHKLWRDFAEKENRMSFCNAIAAMSLPYSHQRYWGDNAAKELLSIECAGVLPLHIAFEETPASLRKKASNY